MNFKLVLASNNRGKLAELQVLFASLGVTLVAQADLGVGEADEPFHTFIENALTKARHASSVSGLPALADDAGLCVHAFDGQPGVQTAYYATRFGYPKGDANNVTALLEQMKGITDRRAAMVSTLVAVRHPDDPEPLVAVGRVQGLIAAEPMGQNGFGFSILRCTCPSLARLLPNCPPTRKTPTATRGKASALMVNLMRSNWF